jgi:CheY-like chemotaxis protein
MKNMKTILQIEDDPNDVFLLQHAMKKAGVLNPIQVAVDGREGIEYLNGTGKFADREQFPFPSLVLLDLKLPQVMGLAVLKWIRQQPWPALTVIMLTASAEPTDLAMAYELGAAGFLVKPSEASKLVEIVTSIRDFWLTHNTLPQVAVAIPCARAIDSRGHSPLAAIPRGRKPSAREPQETQTYDLERPT